MALLFLNHGFMLARLFIVAHAYEQDPSGIAREGSCVGFFLDLVDDRICDLVPFELDDEGWFLRVLQTRQECEVGEALARRQLAHDVVEPPCAVKGQRQRIGERVLVVVLDMARLEMRPLYALAHNGGVFLEGCCEQGVRGLYCAAHDLPFLALLRRCDVFAQNLVVRNKDFLFPTVIAKVTEMHEERHDIVRRGEGRHIIREGQGVDFLPPASHHFDNGIAHSPRFE